MRLQFSGAARTQKGMTNGKTLAFCRTPQRAASGRASGLTGEITAKDTKAAKISQKFLFFAFGFALLTFFAVHFRYWSCFLLHFTAQPAGQ
jgi:hypothetical protein